MGRRNKNNQNNQNNYNNQYYGNNGNSKYYSGSGQYLDQNSQYNNQYYNKNGQYYNQNGQYYNNQQYYNQYSQYNQGSNYQQPKKDDNKFKLDKKMIIIGASVIGAIILLIAGYFIFFNNNDNTEDDGNTTIETLRIGSDKFGYVTVPSDWLKFTDENGYNGIQSSDRNGDYIITLEALPKSEIDAKTYALGKAALLENAGATLTDNQVIKLGEYTAYQVTGYLDTTYFTIWCFEAEDGYSHFIGLEGPSLESEYFQIPYTFSLTK